MNWIDPPPGWMTRPGRGPFVATAQPASWDGPFVPNLMVAVEPTQGTWPNHAERSVAALVDRLALPHLIDAYLDDRSLQLVVAHELFGRRLTLVQRHIAGDGRVAVASYTVADVDWPALWLQILASVETLQAPA